METPRRNPQGDHTSQAPQQPMPQQVRQEPVPRAVPEPAGPEPLLPDFIPGKPPVTLTTPHQLLQTLAEFHEHVSDVAERARMVDFQRATPGAVTLKDIQQRLTDATKSAGLLKNGREASLAEVEAVRTRLDNAIRPYSQDDLNSVNITLLVVMVRIENALGVQG